MEARRGGGRLITAAALAVAADPAELSPVAFVVAGATVVFGLTSTVFVVDPMIIRKDVS